jgi:hypothetical protein
MRRRAFVVVAAVLAAAAAGCKGPPPGKEQFNNILAGENRKLAKASRAFRKAVLPQGGGPADAGQARSALAGIQSMLKEVRADVNYLDTPGGSSKAQAFLDKYKEFLTAEEGFVDKYFKPIVQQAEQKSLTADFVNAQFAALAQEERTSLGAVQTAQNDYCTELNFRAEPLKQWLEEQKAKK